MSNDLRETLAWLEHDRWSRWMRYMLANFDADHLAGWRRQMETDYNDLTEQEKESDRKEADVTLNAIKAQE